MNESARRRFLLACAWIGACLLAGTLLWFFTRTVRTELLTKAANRIIARSGDSRRLSLPAGRAAGFGSWFTLVEVPGGAAVPGYALVFTLMDGTRAASCAAFVTPDGKLEKIVPLSSYAEFVVESLPAPVYKIHAERIAAAALSLFSGGRER